MNEEEKAFIKAFIYEDKQERYLGFIASPKRRVKFLNEFYHRLEFRPSFAEEIHNRDQSVEYIAGKLEEKGSTPQVYVISPNHRFDERWLDIKEALKLILSDGTGSVACCRTGELAFLKNDDGAWILHRPKPDQKTARAKK